MVKTLGIRDLSRSISILKDYDYAQIEDKKTKQIKGLIVSNEYSEQVKKYLDKIIAKKKQQELNQIMQFAGSIEIRDEFKNASPRAINRAKHRKYL